MAAQRSSKQKQKTKIQQKKQPRFGDTMMDEVILIIIVVVSFVVLISLLTKKMGILGGLLGENLEFTVRSYNTHQLQNWCAQYQ